MSRIVKELALLRRAPRFAGWLAVACALACSGGSGPPPPVISQAALTSQGNADDLLVVDCMLPGQVRKLGSKMTYLTQRRPIRTSALDCGIRGGEYVAYDRSSYQTALQVWKPQAEAGDAQAQNYVGEIHERGLGTAPNYAEAARWYRTAADQGYGPAQMNLGQLYELGRGVPQDMGEALRWYRLASGLGGTVPLVVSADSKAELDQLRAELSQAEKEADSLRGELEGVREELDRAREQRGRGEQDIERESRNLDGQRRLLRDEQAQLERDARGLESERASLDTRRRELEAERARLAANAKQRAELDAAAARQRQAELDAAAASQQQQGLDAQAARQRQAELDAQAAKQQQAESAARAARDRQAELDAQAMSQRQAELDTLDRELQSRRRKLVAAKRAADSTADGIAEAERTLAARKDEVARLDARIAELTQQASQEEKRVSALQKEAAASGTRVSVAGPTITMIDPRVPSGRQRGLAVVGTAPAAERVIHGRVEAPSGLSSLLVNDSETPVSDNGLFKARVAVRDQGTRVTVVAIDRSGKRSDTAFMLTPSADTAVAVPAGADKPRGIDFGKYYALVIGNNQYAHLPDLEMAGSDARAISAVLESRYGFRVTTLYDANRYQILTALNELRARLTSEDNLLIYYAGHGELDKVNMRGHWLPVDAEAESSANWISNVQLTDVLNAMSVKHVLVVADSCYSGTLTRASLAQLDSGMTRAARVEWQRKMATKRARTALTSGGLAPVLDAGGGGHSIFAKALLEVLESNDEVLEGSRLHLEVKSLVAYAAARSNFEQLPQYAPIKFAGHESGDFFFVPSGRRGSAEPPSRFATR